MSDLHVTSAALRIERSGDGARRISALGRSAGVALDPWVVQALEGFARPARADSVAGGPPDALELLLGHGLVERAPATRHAPPPPRPCLVTTVRAPGPSFTSFLDHHLRLGFAHAFVFLDGPEEPRCDLTRDGVTVVPFDAHLVSMRRDLRLFRAMAPHLDREVVARQVLNVELAIAMALDRGFDWIVHLDADELLWSARPLPDFLASVPDGVGQVLFFNHEAAPEAVDVHDALAEVTLFKRNPLLCDPAAVAGWQARTGRRFFFLAYENGKAAARVTEDLLPNGVHAFWHDVIEYLTVDALDPCVLHFAYCGFDDYLQKYRQRGRFPDLYFGTAPRLPFHVQSRDAVLDAGAGAARELYTREVVFRDGESRALLSAGLGMRRAAREFHGGAST